MKGRHISTRRLSARLIVFPCVLCATLTGAASAASAATVSLNAPVRVKVNSLLTCRGTASGGAPARVAVERRSGNRWIVISSGNTAGDGRYALTWASPVKAGRVSLRAVASRSGRTVAISRIRQVTVLLVGHKGPFIQPYARTVVLDASTVLAAPRPGSARELGASPGVLRYRGGNDVRAGSIVVIGPGPRTPHGFLGRVTGISRSGGETTLTTKPATLLQAIPSASLHVALGQHVVQLSHAARQAFARAVAAAVKCQGGASATIAPNIGVGASLDFNVDWSFFHGLEDVSISAGAWAGGSLQVNLSGTGQCTLQPITVFQEAGPSGLFWAGPVPVYLASNVGLQLQATTKADADLSVGLIGGLSAQAGVGWASGQGFYPIGSFTQGFSRTGPSLSGAASVEADLVPYVNVLVYDVAGPQISLKTGLKLSADTTQNPWWTLSLPVDVTGQLVIPPLNISSPSLTLWSSSYPLANAGGPFPG